MSCFNHICDKNEDLFLAFLNDIQVCISLIKLNQVLYSYVGEHPNFYYVCRNKFIYIYINMFKMSMFRCVET